MKLHSSTVS